MSISLGNQNLATTIWLHEKQTRSTEFKHFSSKYEKIFSNNSSGKRSILNETLSNFKLLNEIMGKQHSIFDVFQFICSLFCGKLKCD